jgi:signal transduction histidine kinase/ActR/RegA family two-component response regulator
MAAVPLAISDRRTGMLTAFTRGERRLGEHDLRILTLLAAQTAPALEAARLHTELVRAHEELKGANEQLALASRHKSDFLANMSHELRTPLNAILGFSELVLDYGDRPIDPVKRTNYVRHINNSGKHLLNLINDILDLAKVEAGQMVMRPAPIDLAAVISSVRSTMEPLATKNGIELLADCPELLPLEADEDKVRQILLNLLSNAVKFTLEGGRVTVKAWREAGRLLVCVADTGIGIAKGDQERIFGEFQQLDTGGGPRRQGTGLGLALTRRLAELHGGRVWVESELGEGSRFYVELPAGMAHEQLVAAGQPAKGLLVLLIEDDVGAAALLVDMLRREGYRTKVVRDGRRAAREAARLQPLAITLDVMLPGADGWEVLRVLKSSERTRHIPLVMVSVMDERSRGMALGADDYLVKPVDRAALLAAIDRFRLASVAAGPVMTET